MLPAEGDKAAHSTLKTGAARSARRFARRTRAVVDSYRPVRYWERRAPELIDLYERPEGWADRGWNIAGSPEALVVPRLLKELRARSVLVAGAGSGRQYAYLEDEAKLDEIRGFDLSPTMVRECHERFPTIDTVVGDVVDCGTDQCPVDVVLAVTVLQHVRPRDIAKSMEGLKTLARTALILLEFTRFDERSGYTHAHPYRTLMGDWPLFFAQPVGETDTRLTELLAWRRPSTTHPDTA